MTRWRTHNRRRLKALRDQVEIAGWARAVKIVKEMRDAGELVITTYGRGGDWLFERWIEATLTERLTEKLLDADTTYIVPFEPTGLLDEMTDAEWRKANPILGRSPTLIIQDEMIWPLPDRCALPAPEEKK